MENMLEQAKFCGAEVLWESATRIAGPRPFTVTTDGGQDVRTHTVIYATGAAPRYLGLASEKKYMPPNGSGVTSCAVCDGSFYKKRPVAVVGGGDSAMEEATYLSNLCSTVTVVHRREGFRASKVMLERAHAKPNLRWELNQVVDEILGDPRKKAVTGLRLRNVKDGSTKEVQVAAVFMAIGHIPATAILKGFVELDEEGFIKCDSQQQTNAPGFFAAGDCHDRRYRQAVTAAGMGCKAALEAERFLTHEGLI
jgi:thioredoxin reductase (NADPH)